MERQKLLQVFMDEKNNRQLVKYALTLTGNLDDAADLVSDLLIKIYTNDDMQKSKEPIAYFKTCLKNMAYNKRRRDGRMIILPPSDFESIIDHADGGQERAYEDAQTLNELRIMLSQYSSELVDAFIKFHIDGYSIRELAVTLDMRENALSQQFRRMRKKVKAHLRAPMMMLLCFEFLMLSGRG